MKRLMRPYQLHTYLAALALAAVLGLLILARAVFADECENIAGDFSSRAGTGRLPFAGWHLYPRVAHRQS